MEFSALFVSTKHDSTNALWYCDTAWILRQWRKMKSTSLRGRLKYGFTYFYLWNHLNLLSVIKLQWKVAVTLSAILTYTEWKMGTKTAWWSPAKTKRNFQCPDLKCWQDCLLVGEKFVIILRFSYPMNEFWRFCLDSGKQPLGRIFKEICLKRIPRKSVPEKCLKHHIPQSYIRRRHINSAWWAFELFRQT